MPADSRCLGNGLFGACFLGRQRGSFCEWSLCLQEASGYDISAAPTAAARGPRGHMDSVRPTHRDRYAPVTHTPFSALSEVHNAYSLNVLHPKKNELHDEFGICFQRAFGPTALSSSQWKGWHQALMVTILAFIQ